MVETPSTRPHIRLGTRRSPLAMAQAHEVRDRLCVAHGWGSEAVEIVGVQSSGDKIQDRPLAEIGGKALWTRELDTFLLAERIDIAVHSLKDVETLRPPEIVIGAVLERADVADRLVGASSLSAIPQGALVGTSAPRRAAQMLYHRPDCTVRSLRGNVATRLGKLAAGEVDVTLLAAAGLDRLGEDGVGTRLPPEDWLPAPQQGAIGVEARAEDAETLRYLAAIDCTRTHRAITVERAILAALGGTCHSPVAMLSDVAPNGSVAVRTAVFSAGGSQRVEGRATFKPGDIDAGDFARSLLARSSDAIRALFPGAA